MSAVQKPQSLAIRLSRQYKPQVGSKKARLDAPSKDTVKEEEVKGTVVQAESRKIKLNAPGNNDSNGDVPKIIKELEFDLNKPLKLVLEEVFDKEGTVVLTFQGAPYYQVLKYAERINYQLKCHLDAKVPSLTANNSEKTRNSKSGDKAEVRGDVDSPTQAEDFGDWTIKVEVVEVLISNIASYKRKLELEFDKHDPRIHPDVQVVSLMTSLTSPLDSVDLGCQQVLTIDPHGGPVFFKDYNPDDRLDDLSLFLRVEYQSQKREPSKIIWINLNTLLPIEYRESENQFYADIPYTSFHPSTPVIGAGSDPQTNNSKAAVYADDPDDGDIPPALSNPFHYIEQIIDNPPFNYHVHGGTKDAIIYPVGGTTKWRISKGKPNIHGVAPAILDTSEQKFNIMFYQFEDHT